MNLTLIFISHDLSVVKHMSDRIAVMYLGKIVELGSPGQGLRKPSASLHQSAHQRGANSRSDLRKSAPTPRLTGRSPSPLNPPVGCRFHPRCPYCIEQCKAQQPRRWLTGVKIISPPIFGSRRLMRSGRFIRTARAIEVNRPYLAARSFSNRESPRSGSHSGSTRNVPGVGPLGRATNSASCCRARSRSPT
jgi:oligopeptide/dipeptide ABC transporter ATP-binding protein